jgi:hypothetical protein
MLECRIDIAFDGLAAVNVNVVVGGEVSFCTTVTELGLTLQLGGVAAVTGSPTILGSMLHDRFTVLFPVVV